MSRIIVAGIGAVSPAGWGVDALSAAVERGEKAASSELVRPGWDRALSLRAVPSPAAKPSFLAHPRLRRTSPISQYAVAAALEALGAEAAAGVTGGKRLGVILCVMSGCVNYSRRFFDEVLREPSTASPLVFPETVFNAPSSHLAALLGTTEINYTLVGDPGVFLQGLALAAQWLSEQLVDGCLLVGAEEKDWLTADAFRMFSRRLILGEGAGALYLQRESEGVAGPELAAVTDAELFFSRGERAEAARRTSDALRKLSPDGVLCDGLQGVPLMDRAEAQAWAGWKGARKSVKKYLGEGLMAAAAWQCVLAVQTVRQGARDAIVPVTGCNQQSIGAIFRRTQSA